MYAIGKTGTGKSTLLETLIRQDMLHGEGLALLDPHGDLAERVVHAIPESRRADLVYFDVADPQAPLAFNPLESVPAPRRALAASGILGAFRKIWADSWGPRLEHILRNSLLLLLDQPEATFADVPRLLGDAPFRKQALLHATSRPVYDFWIKEYDRYPERFRAEAVAPLQNKVGAFLSIPVLHRILTQPKSAFDLRSMMDQGKIFLVNLAKGKVGEDAAALMGALLVSGLSVAALGRADVPESDRRDFYCYLDEFPTYASASLAAMMSELRKYRLNLILAHQFLTQLDEPVRDAILGNAGTIIAFRVGPADAEILEKEFAPEFTATDLISLPNRSIYLKLMIDGKISSPFSADSVHIEPGQKD